MIHDVSHTWGWQSGVQEKEIGFYCSFWFNEKVWPDRTRGAKSVSTTIYQFHNPWVIGRDNMGQIWVVNTLRSNTFRRRLSSSFSPSAEYSALESGKRTRPFFRPSPSAAGEKITKQLVRSFNTFLIPRRFHKVRGLTFEKGDRSKEKCRIESWNPTLENNLFCTSPSLPKVRILFVDR